MLPPAATALTRRAHWLPARLQPHFAFSLWKSAADRADHCSRRPITLMRAGGKTVSGCRDTGVVLLRPTAAVATSGEPDVVLGGSLPPSSPGASSECLAACRLLPSANARRSLLATLLIHGARAVIIVRKGKYAPIRIPGWIAYYRGARPIVRRSGSQANKMARQICPTAHGRIL